MDKNVLKNLSYGMYVIGAKNNKLVGCIANTVIQVTNSPITILVSINHDNYTNEIIKKTNKFSVTILGNNIDPKIIGTFGFTTSKDTDKYKNIDYKEIMDVPILKDGIGALVCKVIKTIELSSHTIFIGEVIEMESLNDDIPMTYSYYKENLKGKSPSKAPTYNEEENNNSNKNNKKYKWRCKVCGYEFESNSEELPKDFICPICGKPHNFFERIE